MCIIYIIVFGLLWKVKISYHDFYGTYIMMFFGSVECQGNLEEEIQIWRLRILLGYILQTFLPSTLWLLIFQCYIICWCFRNSFYGYPLIHIWLKRFVLYIRRNISTLHFRVTNEQLHVFWCTRLSAVLALIYAISFI